MNQFRNHKMSEMERLYFANEKTEPENPGR